MKTTQTISQNLEVTKDNIQVASGNSRKRKTILSKMPPKKVTNISMNTITNPREISNFLTVKSNCRTVNSICECFSYSCTYNIERLYLCLVSDFAYALLEVEPIHKKSLARCALCLFVSLCSGQLLSGLEQQNARACGCVSLWPLYIITARGGSGGNNESRAQLAKLICNATAPFRATHVLLLCSVCDVCTQM